MPTLEMRMLIKGYIFVLLVPNDLGFSVTFFSYLKESRTVLVSGFHAVDSGFLVLDSEFFVTGTCTPEEKKLK